MQHVAFGGWLFSLIIIPCRPMSLSVLAQQLSWDKYTSMELLGGMTVTCLVLYESAQLFSRVPTLFLIPVNNVYGASQVEVVKNPSASAGDIRDTGSIPGLERSPRGGNGCWLQYSCLEFSHGQRSLVGYKSQGCKDLDTTEVTWHTCTAMYMYLMSLHPCKQAMLSPLFILAILIHCSIISLVF